MLFFISFLMLSATMFWLFCHPLFLRYLLPSKNVKYNLFFCSIHMFFSFQYLWHLVLFQENCKVCNHQKLCVQIYAYLAENTKESHVTSIKKSTWEILWRCNPQSNFQIGWGWWCVGDKEAHPSLWNEINNRYLRRLKKIHRHVTLNN